MPEEATTPQVVSDVEVTRAILAGVEMKEYRCNFCGILVFKGSVPAGGLVQINCPRDRCDRTRKGLLPEQRFLTFAGR
jgi:phage FluMu protein Com